MHRPKLVPAPYYEHSPETVGPRKRPSSKWPYESKGNLKAFYVNFGNLRLGRITEHERHRYKLSGMIRYGDTYTYFWVPEIITPADRYKELIRPYSGPYPNKTQAVNMVLKAAIEADLI